MSDDDDEIETADPCVWAIAERLFEADRKPHDAPTLEAARPGDIDAICEWAERFIATARHIGLTASDLAGLAEGSRVVVPVERTFEAGVRAIRSEVYALHDDTLARYHDCGRADTEGKPGAYARGRCAEAKSIARAIGEVVYALAARPGAKEE